MFSDYIKTYWPIVMSLLTIGVTIVTQWALLGQRITALESRQDRQEQAVVDVKAQLTVQAANYAALSAKIDAIGDNVSYIRSRVDAH